MAVGKIVEGDTVTLRGEVTRVSDDGRDITVRVRDYGIPLTVNRNHVQAVEKVPVTAAAPSVRSAWLRFLAPPDGSPEFPIATLCDFRRTNIEHRLDGFAHILRFLCARWLRVCHRRAPKLNIVVKLIRAMDSAM